jgi:crotonobetainyl-CoA:carnitine CoA-transferase CaiB-like acyl-CoA transferase
MAHYSVQAAADEIFRDVLLRDHRLQLPEGTAAIAARTKFSTQAMSKPFLPTPMKMTESITALWALAASIGNFICRERYGIEQDVMVNSDTATLFLMSSVLATVGGKPLSDKELAKRYEKYDTGQMFLPCRRVATNIYPTKDGRWYHLHASMNADRILEMLGNPQFRVSAPETEYIE